MDKIDELLTRRVEKVLPSKDDLKKLLQTKKIRLYNGIDPTATKLHLGHTVGLRKLMEFAELGHEVILLFGTGTVLVGDPSQREKGRKLITKTEIKNNIKTWKKQVSPIVNFDKLEIKYNADWLTKLNLTEIIKIASHISAVQLFKRDMFQKRLDRGDTVWYHETMYPLLQGYDSVVMNVDLEIGGSDQEFNMLIGRELQKKMNKHDKYVLTWPMIMGTDGKQMSKTTANCVWLDDPPNDMYGKLMSIPDDQIIPYFELVTNAPFDQINNEKKALENNENPATVKRRLAYQVVKEFHGDQPAQTSQEYFDKTYKDKKPEYETEIEVPAGTKLAGTVALASGTSTTESKRQIAQGAIDYNEAVTTNPSLEVKTGDKIKIGKKIHIKVKVK